jgi:group II intron reverse transcriptase/maturase
LSQEAVDFTGVKVMGIGVKRVERQMNLFDTGEWRDSHRPITGIDVYDARSGGVRPEWLSDCEKERVLTSDLVGSIAEIGNLTQAYRRVIANGGSPGIDGMNTGELKEWFSLHWRELQRELLIGEYKPSLVKGVKIPKPKGGTRQLGIPVVTDRLVEQAIHQVMSPRYERIFSDHSYGFRPGRSAHGALREGAEHVAEGYTWLVDIDLAKFFDTVNHQRLLWLLSRRIGDKKLLKLIHRFLKAGLMQDGLVSQRTSGTPQGGPLSPLLSNIVLDELDKELERRGHRFVRYADDMRVFLKSEESARRVMESLTRFIENRMKLKVNREKSTVCRCWETNFLGHSLLVDGTLGISQESERRMKATLRRITCRRRGISLEQLLSEINPKLRGWLNYFHLARMRKKVQVLTSWLLHRIRCFRLKQCKRAIGIVRFLKGLNVPEWRCWLLALSGKGWWRLSGSPQAHEGMSRQWFNQIGLFDLNANYHRLQLEETAVYVSTHGGVRGR